MAKTVRCPTCNAPVEWTPQAHWRPFCSERCKQIDLGAWASNQYAIPGRADEATPSSDNHDERA